MRNKQDNTGRIEKGGRKMQRRFTVMSVPYGDGDEAYWFCYDQHLLRAIECDDRAAAVETAKLSNLAGKGV